MHKGCVTHKGTMRVHSATVSSRLCRIMGNKQKVKSNREKIHSSQGRKRLSAMHLNQVDMRHICLVDYMY